MRDGGSFTTRRVTARQHGHPIFSMLVSFHVEETGGLDHQAKMPDVPDPESLPSETETRAKILPAMPEAVRRYYERERPIELRPVEFERYLGKKFPDGKFNVWIKTTGPLPDDPAKRQAIMLVVGRAEYGRPMLTAPDVPADRLAALRQAFAETMKDPDFIKDATTAELEVNPVSGEQLQKLTDEIMATNPDVATRVRTILAATQ